MTKQCPLRGVICRQTPLICMSTYASRYADVVSAQLDNVLLHGRGERPVVKICDFGYSKDEVAGSICKTACGTPEYMAPEVRFMQRLNPEPA